MHKAKYLLPGSFMSEEIIRTLPERTIAAALEAAPDRAFAFTFYDVADDIPDLGPEFRVVPVPLNPSAKHYIDGVLLRLEEVERMGDEYRILASNMRSNGWDVVVKCRTGNFQPFESGVDHLVLTHLR